ncbi:hypothetical protein [Nannocystis bainbridge]|uniref:Transcriptional regulator n=1 Tax=Nannocystis bainbridge TaxID=2995303 RepID=A0ABT5DST0_9BACT|nr:hypothetical protein [Nannocystis bainbridge]MDC0716678.1 hypothetical protein [Nannocystis bainbridge]
MSKFDLVAAMEDRKRELLIELLLQHPQLTLAELQQLARGELGSLLRSITISDLQGRHGSQTPVREAPGGKAAPAKSHPTNTVEVADVNTRTHAGREAFDKRLLEVVTAIGGPVSASQVQERIGGSNMQVRAGLNRLIEAGELTWSGKARGTRYHLN